jgi:hypothetical protein
MLSESLSTNLDSLFSEILLVKELIYDPCGFSLSSLETEKEGKEYRACTFLLEGKKVKHRVSKITPTKVGQFVAIWKRDGSGVTAPFELSDEIDFILITSRIGDNLGQFIFSKSVLVEKGIIAVGSKGGKRGIRVYPPWDKVTSKQAKNTQDWQVKYFVELTNVELIDVERMKILMGGNK